jgi:hypothetical protein
MLEFLVLEASTSATVEAVLSFLVAVDPSLAGAVYKKARHVRPELVAGYGPRFEAAFAQALLR